MHLGTWLKCMKYIGVSLNGIIQVSGYLNSLDYVTCKETEEMLKILFSVPWETIPLLGVEWVTKSLYFFKFIWAAVKKRKTVI